jgi:hypothetical protein
LVPPVDQEASCNITGSEEILKACPSKNSLNARIINDNIKDLLKNPAFNADEVDHDMLRCLQASIDSGDIQIIKMNVEGDGSTSKCVLLLIYRYHIQSILYRYHTR